MRQTLLTLLRKIRELLSPLFRRYDEKIPYIIILVIALSIVIGSINLFIELTATLQTEIIADYDNKVTDYILSYRSPVLTPYFLFVTNLGDFYGYSIVVIICFILSIAVFKNWKYVAQTTLVLVLATGSNMVLKRFVDRARPGIEHLVSVETLSYPSGHAMSAMAFYGFLIFLFYKFKMNRFLKYVAILICIVLIVSIGISRIYLGVHYPSDIAGGFIAGFIWVVFCVLLFDLIDIFRRDPTT